MSLFKKKIKTDVVNKTQLNEVTEYIKSNTKVLKLINATKEAEDIMFDMCAANNPEGYVEEAFLKINRDPLTMLTFDAEAISFLHHKNPKFVKEHHLEQMCEYADTFSSDFEAMCMCSFAYQYLKAKGIDIKDSSPIPMNQAPFVAFISPAPMLNPGPAIEISKKSSEEQEKLSSYIWKNTLWLFNNFFEKDAPYRAITLSMGINKKFKQFAYNSDGQFDFTTTIKNLTIPDEFEKQCKKCKIDLTPVSEKEQGIQK